MSDRPLHPVCREHLDVLAGPFGIWQHAQGSLPNEAFGSCTDDVVRALTIDLLHGRELGWDAVRPAAWDSLRFLSEAQNPASGWFRNFRAADGAWLDDGGSEDCQGRALLALGTALSTAPEKAAADEARRMFVAALPTASRLGALRATASALLGCDAALDGGLRGETRRVFEMLAARLGRAFAVADLAHDWPWPEPVLTYENALLPRALLAAGVRLGDDHLRRSALRVLDWLIRVQTTPEGSFSPIGSSGWWPRGGVRSRFDQQPIEAASMILAAEAAFRVTRAREYLAVVETAYGWYLGDNDLGIAVADVTTGGCCDGLTPKGVNVNQGAESTLMWLTALEHVRRLRRAFALPSARTAESPASHLVGVIS